MSIYLRLHYFSKLLVLWASLWDCHDIIIYFYITCHIQLWTYENGSVWCPSSQKYGKKVTEILSKNKWYSYAIIHLPFSDFLPESNLFHMKEIIQHRSKAPASIAFQFSVFLTSLLFWGEASIVPGTILMWLFSPLTHSIIDLSMQNLPKILATK